MIRRTGLFVSLAWVVACSGVPTPSTSTYVATAGEGDLAEWTLSSGGGAFSVKYTPSDSTGLPVDGGAFTFSGTCGAKDVSYDYRICAVASVVPARDAGFPRPSDNFFVLELPGVAVIAAPLGDTRDAGAQTHVGLVRGACGDFSGSYSFARVAPPGYIPHIMGQFTLVGNNAGEISSIDAWHYGLVVNGQASTGSNADPIRVALLTDPANAHPSVLDAGATTCVGGVVTAAQTVVESTDGGGTTEKTFVTRVNVTGSGALLIDLPFPLGGAVGIRSEAAASLSDLLGRSFVVLARTEGGGGDLLNVTIDGDAGVTINSALVTSGGPWTVGKVVALSNPIVDAYFGATNILDIYNRISGTNAFGPPDGGQAAAPAPSTFAGFFAIVDSQNRLGTATNTGETDIFLAQKSASGIFLVGSNVDVNQTGDFSCAAAYGYQLYCISGPFMGFSR